MDNERNASRVIGIERSWQSVYLEIMRMPLFADQKTLSAPQQRNRDYLLRLLRDFFQSRSVNIQCGADLNGQTGSEYIQFISHNRMQIRYLRFPLSYTTSKRVELFIADLKEFFESVGFVSIEEANRDPKDWQQALARLSKLDIFDSSITLDYEALRNLCLGVLEKIVTDKDVTKIGVETDLVSGESYILIGLIDSAEQTLTINLQQPAIEQLNQLLDGLKALDEYIIRLKEKRMVDAFADL